jgi:3-hydroxyisobutyrate dehydrogenase-like beta-hydroxyacid dehydrogenase
MGTGMAKSLLRAGHSVVVYNRSPEKMEQLASQGAQMAASLAEACRCDAVMTMLANDEAVEAVVLGPGGVADCLAAGALHVSSSTISVAMAKRLAQEHARRGQRFVSAPVFGRPDAAAAARLFVVAAGDAAARQMADPLFRAIGQRTFAVSETPEAANLVKLSGNFLSASVIESLGEALALIARGGVDQQTYLEFLTTTLFGAPVFKTYGPLLIERRFEPAGFAATLGDKDIRLLLGAAAEMRVSMPLANLIHERFLHLFARGGEHMDWSAIGALSVSEASDDRHIGKVASF